MRTVVAREAGAVATRLGAPTLLAAPRPREHSARGRLADAQPRAPVGGDLHRRARVVGERAVDGIAEGTLLDQAVVHELRPSWRGATGVV